MNDERKARSVWRASRPLPERFETARTVLRFWQPSDAAGMVEALDVDRDSFRPWLPWMGDNRTEAECIYHIERFRRRALLRAADDFTLGIFDRTTGTVIGGTGLHRMDRSAHHAEIGYWVRPDRRRQGLCTEAVAGLISWAFVPQSSGGWGLRRLDIFCAGSNVPSQRIPQKLGLRQEVHKRQARWVEGRGWEDTLGWGVLQDEWDCAAHCIRRERR